VTTTGTAVVPYEPHLQLEPYMLALHSAVSAEPLAVGRAGGGTLRVHLSNQLVLFTQALQVVGGVTVTLI
jgi:hypothetical protein